MIKDAVYSSEQIKGQTFSDERFQNCKFSLQQFKFTVFENCTFDFCDFSNALLNSTSFENCSFSECKLSWINFKDTNLIKCNFKKSVLFLVAFLLGSSAFAAGAVRTISVSDMAEKIDQRRVGEANFLLIDLRNEVDYAKGHLPGAVNLPVSKHILS